jgi:hypothetical protein
MLSTGLCVTLRNKLGYDASDWCIGTNVSKHLTASVLEAVQPTPFFGLR